jgi:hypothetical protein
MFFTFLLTNDLIIVIQKRVYLIKPLSFLHDNLNLNFDLARLPKILLQIHELLLYLFNIISENTIHLFDLWWTPNASICYVSCKYCFVQLMYHGGAVVEALCFKPEGCGINSRWCNWNFYWHNPSGRTMALGSTQLLAEMNTRNISGG